MSRTLIAACWAVAGALALATAGFAQGDAISPSPAFAAEDLAAPPRADWVTNGGNLFNQRYSPLTGLNRDNVGALKGKWRASLDGSGLGPELSGEAQLLVYAGVIYVVTGQDDVFAIGVDDGSILWRYTAALDPDRVRACCGWVSRGLGMGEGKVFVGQLDGKLVALDQTTGEVAWSVQAESPDEGFSITSAPLYYDGMVITGFAGGDLGARGRVKAYDAATGDLVWTFFTIPGPGEAGHETWPSDNDAWKYGGAPVWQTPAVDPELGLVYFATGNPGPLISGAVRPGDNLFTDSVIALDAHTGEYRWHFQEVRHDIWDYDSSNPVVLFDVEMDGALRHGIAQAGKTGYLYLLDRVTGEPLVGIVDTPVPQEPSQATAATQPIPIGDDIVPHVIDIAPEGWTLRHQGQTFTPSRTGEPTLYTPIAAINWPPSSYDPETGLMYICANDAISGARAAEPGDVEIGVPEWPGRYRGGFWASAGLRGRGIFAAVDVRTNRLAWRQQWADRCNSGSVVTAGGLVFVGRNDGRLTALDKTDGSPLWSFQTDAGINTTVTVFEHDGQTLVAVLAGGAFTGGKRGDGVWLFSLDGKMESLPPGSGTASARPAVGGADQMIAVVAPARAPDLAAGQATYESTCIACHGADGQGSNLGGKAYTSALTVETIMGVALNGQGDMPPFGQLYDQEQLYDVASYIVERLIDQ